MNLKHWTLCRFEENISYVVFVLQEKSEQVFLGSWKKEHSCQQFDVLGSFLCRRLLLTLSLKMWCEFLV